MSDPIPWHETAEPGEEAYHKLSGGREVSRNASLFRAIITTQTVRRDVMPNDVYDDIHASGNVTGFVETSNPFLGQSSTPMLGLNCADPTMPGEFSREMENRGYNVWHYPDRTPFKFLPRYVKGYIMVSHEV